MHNRCAQQICLVYCTAERPGEVKGMNGRVVKDNHEVFPSAEHKQGHLSRWWDGTYDSPASRYPIPLPYELCTL